MKEKVYSLARFVTGASFGRMSKDAVRELKLRILDSLGCALGALDAEPIRMLGEHLSDFGGNGTCTQIGGGKTAPDRAALFNGALVRYLDFNDSYLAKGETCHPSDNLGAVLSACEYAERDGKDLLVSLGVSYQVQCRLSDAAPVRARGFDHTTQGSFAVASGVSKALGLDVEKTAHAIAIAGTAFNALRVTRTGRLSHWKGLAYPNTAFCATHAAFLASRGITGPLEVFEGNKGFMETIAGPFVLDWSVENLERVRLTSIKKYNAEFHSQSCVEGILELKAEHRFTPGEIEGVEIEIFDVAFHIIGGGEEGAKTEIRTKEEADHSLPYILAAALLDGGVMPEQYRPERIVRKDVQDLLRKIRIRPSEAFSRRFPEEMRCRIRVFLKDGRVHEREKKDYQGFHTRPFDWDAAIAKLTRLASPVAGPAFLERLVDAVYRLEEMRVSDLTGLLGKISRCPVKISDTDGHGSTRMEKNRMR